MVLILKYMRNINRKFAFWVNRETKLSTERIIVNELERQHFAARHLYLHLVKNKFAYNIF